MAEATLQTLTSSLPGEEPFIGDLSDGELYLNTADGRIWTGDPLGYPVELGGAIKNHPIGSNLITSNYMSIDVTSPDNLPISNPNPLEIPEGFYQECRILLRFVGIPLQNFSTYFDYPVNWGNDSSWKIRYSDSSGGGEDGVSDLDADNPIDYFKAQGKDILVELSSFGPNSYWIGRLLWVGPNS